MLSIYPEIRERFIAAYKNAPIDLASFHRLYKSCAGGCDALCCSGGAGFYYPEESATIRKVVNDNQEFFARRGITQESKLFDEEPDEDTGQLNLSTNVKPFTYPAGVKPAHFDDTACIFRDPNGWCALQVLSREQGHEPWHFKPVACWLFPIELEYDGKPHISIAHHSTDEYIDEEYPGFTGFTGCGAECKKTGTPVYKIVEQELKLLSEWLERDLLAEILAYEPEQRLSA